MHLCPLHHSHRIFHCPTRHLLLRHRTRRRHACRLLRPVQPFLLRSHISFFHLLLFIAFPVGPFPRRPRRHGFVPRLPFVFPRRIRGIAFFRASHAFTSSHFMCAFRHAARAFRHAARAS